MMVFAVEEPVFKTEPLFVLGMPWAKFDTMMMKRYQQGVGLSPEQCVGRVGTMLTYAATPWRVVWTRDLDLHVVLHETFHLVTRICHDKGIPIVAQTDHGPGDETAAYLLEFFMRQIVDRLDRRKLWQATRERP